MAEFYLKFYLNLMIAGTVLKLTFHQFGAKWVLM